MAIFYLFYRLLLNKETFHKFNRFILLIILVASWLIPVLQVTTTHNTDINDTFLSIEQLVMLAFEQETLSVEAIAVIPDQIVAPSLTAGQWAIRIGLILYFLGIAFFVIRYISTMFQFLIFARRCRKERLENNCVLLISTEKVAPFSWMKWIVISEEDYHGNRKEIIVHELAHIQKRHSIDLLIVDLSAFLQWFNPAVWLMKQELQNIHEYEADEAVIKQGIDAKKYQLLLIKKAVGTRLYSMANSLNHSTLKRRISMMMKEKSSPWARAKSLCLLPLAAIAVTVFARPEISAVANEISTVKVNDLVVNDEKMSEEIATALVSSDNEDVLKNTPIEEEAPVKALIDTKTGGVSVLAQKKDTLNSLQNPKDQVYTIASVMPSFPGGQEALQAYLAKNLNEPADGKGQRIFVKFVVNESGRPYDISFGGNAGKRLTELASTNSAIAAKCDELVKVFKDMPDWHPGEMDGKKVDVMYTVPVRISVNDLGLRLDDTTPITIVNGKVVNPSSIPASQIENMEFVKDNKDYIAKYGEGAKNGVIIIKLKSEEESAKAVPADEVNGVVKDVNGDPIPGVIVQIEGGDKGTVTGLDGQFKLKATEGDRLKISYMGMKSTTLNATPGKSVTVIMKTE